LVGKIARPNAAPWNTEAFQKCNNWGRWGDDDELGTLNLITPQKRHEAAALVRTGEVVSLSRAITHRAESGSISLQIMLLSPSPELSVNDAMMIAPHGRVVTHLDAIGHVHVDGILYNGRLLDETLTPSGLNHCDIAAMREGIFTRGVFLDVASARGVTYLESGQGVSGADLTAAERHGNTAVGEGDAVIVRVGTIERCLAEHTADERQVGLTADGVMWLQERNVAVFGGDCIEKWPSADEGIPHPLHQIGVVSMGLVLLDNPEVRSLKATCERLGRFGFLLVAGPLVVEGGTGSPVNPLAIF
jgi:kynurenine formamidase